MCPILLISLFYKSEYSFALVNHLKKSRLENQDFFIINLLSTIVYKKY